MSDLFQNMNAALKRDIAAAKDSAKDPAKNPAKEAGSYSAQDIEVLEGLEPVRRRPGMYIGGTDERALHHLVAEVLDNAMDEAVAGHATRIELELGKNNQVTIRDNGRGIPIDEHPKYPGKSALEVIMTTLHSGGKFGGDAYSTSGGLHGVGVSVVNALSESLVVEVARDRMLYRQSFSKGEPTSALEQVSATQNRRGSTLIFTPDLTIFGEDATFKAETLYKMARSKAYLFRGVEIRWSCDPSLIRPDKNGKGIPANDTIKFPNGLADYLSSLLGERPCLTQEVFAGETPLQGAVGKVEWAIAWPEDEDPFLTSYCNTVPTPQGGTHETGLRSALTRGLKAYGAMTGNKRADALQADDVLGGAVVLLSFFMREPQFQGQTKEKLVSVEASRLVDAAIKDRFDLWLASNPAQTRILLERLIERAEDRARKKDDKDTARKSATRRLRLPGKLTDCSRNSAEGTEIFLVEGDSAGGSAKQARAREIQAILPLKGKILNVASASADKIKANQEVSDLTQALGAGLGKDFKADKLRYERVIIMTDADVDGAHIATLLITFFYRFMRGVIEDGRLYLALPPLYRIVAGGKSQYARDDAHKEEILANLKKGRGNAEISRFKGLGEMPAKDLKETTMDPAKRSLMRVTVPDAAHRAAILAAIEAGNPDAGVDADDLVERLMGRNADSRFRFIQDNAQFAKDLDV